MSYEDSRGSGLQRGQAWPPAETPRSMAPGKRTRTMSLPPPDVRAPAPVQQKRGLAHEAVQMRAVAADPASDERTRLTDQWLAMAARPDLFLTPSEEAHGAPADASVSMGAQEPLSTGSSHGSVQRATNPSAASPTAAPAPSPAAAGAAAIDPPQPGIDKPGFIDNDDGSNIRTGPAELNGVALTGQPLPPATRVFVTGRHPSTSEWWYVTAFLPTAIVRGYVQGFRVNTDLPEPTAKLYQIKAGDTAERLAVQEFSAAVRDGHDLRYYENVLLAINRDKNRAGIKGTFQDPGILGGGANNIQLEAGRRIWLVSPAYARALEGKVPDGSLTNGVYAKTQRVLGHIDDLVLSVTDSPRFFGAVAGEYAQAIKDHLPEIIGITAGFILAESASAFLAATPTGVGQLAAVLIQLALAAFGAKLAVDACVQALQHGQQWLTLAWTAHADPEQLADASKQFLKMLVNIAMAALTIAGVRANVGKGLKVADAIKIQPPTMGWSPAMVTPNGGVISGGPVFTPGSIASAGPVDIGPSLMSATGSGGSKANPEWNRGNRRDSERDRHGGGIKQIEQVARKYKMTPEQRRAFGDYVEQAKMMSGRGGADNYTWQELEQLAQEFVSHGG